MKPLVIYHGGRCVDGFCAAWIFHRYVGGEHEFRPALHGDLAPNVKGRSVYVVDFSYPRPVLEAMHQEASNLVVLDHHQTAAAALRGLPYCTFDMDLSGAQLTWDFFEYQGYGLGTRRHWLVEYTADRDLWRWQLPSSRKINAAIRSYPLDFTTWDALADMNPQLELVIDGEAILRAESQVIEEHVARAREVELEGYKVLSVNATTLFSEIAGELAKDRPFGVVWFERDNVRQYSLRSDKTGIDVSKIAKAHGGGGHKHAAGFQESI